jgi:hypothetical protein
MSVNLQKKLSVAKVFGKITAVKVAQAENQVLKIMRVFGSATGKKTGVSDFGEWVALTGQFRAINPATGETFDSATLFLPDVALDLIVAQLDGGAQAVDFAFDISAVADESVAVGYSYRASPLIEAEAESPLARLEAKLASVPALAAPKAEEEKPKGKK